MRKNAEDLKGGDLFDYEGVKYVTLSSFTDERHTQTIVTTVKQAEMNSRPMNVAVFRFFRTSKLEICGGEKVTVTAVMSPTTPITEADQNELTQIRSTE